MLFDVSRLLIDPDKLRFVAEFSQLHCSGMYALRCSCLTNNRPTQLNKNIMDTNDKTQSSKNGTSISMYDFEGRQITLWCSW